MTRMIVLAVLAVAAVAVLPASTATAACENSQAQVDPSTLELVWVCEDGGSTTVPGGGGGGSSVDEDGNVVCQVGDRVIDCVTWAGTWTGTCYLQVDPNPPGFDDPVWEGNTDGYIVECTPEYCVSVSADQDELHCYETSTYWVPTADVGPTPQELAERAVGQMQVRMGEIGSTPPSTDVKPDSVGLVGVPVWVWIADPGEETTGPIVRSAGEGGLSVRAEGRLDRIEWTLADDSGDVYRTVTCAGDDAPGTRWDDESAGDDLLEPSPTCGFDGRDNSLSGHLTLTGTAYWTVEWEGGGEEGTLDLATVSDSTELVMSELQVVNQ